MAYIEHDFPIEQIMPLARREANAKRSIYQLHKWFARRLGCIFRRSGQLYPGGVAGIGTSAERPERCIGVTELGVVMRRRFRKPEEGCR